MSDPKWTECLIPVMPQAVSALTEIIAEDLMDVLLKNRCLTRSKYVEMIESLGRAEIDQSRNARNLFIKLMLSPPPSFDVFCSTMRAYEGGDKLLRVLTSSASSHITAQESANCGDLKSPSSLQQLLPQPDRASRIPRLKKSETTQVCLSSKRAVVQCDGSSTSEPSGERSFSDIRMSRHGDESDCAIVESVIVHIDKTLEEEFTPYRSSVEVLIQSIYGGTEKRKKPVEVTFGFVDSMLFSLPLLRQKKAEKGEHNVEIPVQCNLRVYLPNTNVERFLAQKERLLRAIPSLLGYENIEVLPGSCFVFVTLRGIDFVRFLSDLHDSLCLIAFIQLDPGAEIQFDNLQPVRITRLLEKSTLLKQRVSEALSVFEHVCRKITNSLCWSRFLFAHRSLDFSESLQSGKNVAKMIATLQGASKTD